MSTPVRLLQMAFRLPQAGARLQGARARIRLVDKSVTPHTVLAETTLKDVDSADQVDLDMHGEMPASGGTYVLILHVKPAQPEEAYDFEQIDSEDIFFEIPISALG